VRRDAPRKGSFQAIPIKPEKQDSWQTTLGGKGFAKEALPSESLPKQWIVKEAGKEKKLKTEATLVNTRKHFMGTIFTK